MGRPRSTFSSNKAPECPPSCRSRRRVPDLPRPSALVSLSLFWMRSRNGAQRDQVTAVRADYHLPWHRDKYRSRRVAESEGKAGVRQSHPILPPVRVRHSQTSGGCLEVAHLLVLKTVRRRAQKNKVIWNCITNNQMSVPLRKSRTHPNSDCCHYKLLPRACLPTAYQYRGRYPWHPKYSMHALHLVL